MKFTTTLSVLTICLSVGLSAQVSVLEADGKWRFEVDGQPFEIKGVTFGYDHDVENYDRYFEELKFMGVNAVRTWNYGEYSQELLDAAHAQGIKVMMGIWMRHGRPGMEADDSFNYLEDVEGMEAMFNESIAAVELYKDHPALLTWGVGNEVYLNMATDEEKQAYSIFLEKVCSKIKSLDPNHPIASVEAWTFGLDWWEEYVPSLDIYAINCYGAGADVLQDEIDSRAITKPYMITEFGVRGEWDSSEDANGVLIEPDDNEKYETIVTGYTEWISPKPSCLGVFNFHYSDANTHMSPWLLTHHRGNTRPQYWAIREAYTGEKPLNNVPEIQEFALASNAAEIGDWVPVTLQTTDLEEEGLTIDFFYNQRTGSRARRDQLNPLVFRGNLSDGFEIQMPVEEGPIKVYVNVTDTYPNVGIATTSLVVIDEDGQSSPYKVATTELPFYVYEDGLNMPYAPSGYMGNYYAMDVDTRWQENPYSGDACMKIAYSALSEWYGLALMEPNNDWGDQAGGYDVSGARKFSFWAKADGNGVKATIGFGLIEDKPFPDSVVEHEDIILTQEWQQFRFNVRRSDLRCIRTGFVLFSSARGISQTIFIDDIVFE